MRSEVQDLLDKDWPDNTASKYARYGATKKHKALVRLAMRAEDEGDDELYDQAVEQASIIPCPYDKSEYIEVMFPLYHTRMHDGNQKIICFKEKHGDWRFVADTAKDISMAFLTIINARLEDNWYMDELYGDDLPKEGEDINQTDLFKNTAPKKTDSQQAQDIVDLARSGEPGCVIKAGKYAYGFLDERTDGQYEDFSIEYPDKATFDLTPS